MSEAAEGSVARKTAIGATWMVAWRLVTRALGMVSTLVLARILVPADFGLLAMATTFSNAIDALSQIGLQDALLRRVEDDRQLYDAAFSMQVCRALITGAVIAIAAPAASWWFGEPRLGPILMVLAVVSVISGFENVGIVEFRRTMRYDKHFMLLTGPRLFQVAVTVPLAFMLQSYWVLVCGIAIGKVSRVIASYVFHPYRPRFGFHGWRDLIGFSFWTWATAIVLLVWERSDPFILGPVVGSSALGMYLLAYELAVLPVSEIVYPAADALLAGFSTAQKRGTDPVSVAMNVSVTLLLGVMPIVIAISGASGYIVAALLGPKWIGAQPLVAVLAWQCVFSPFTWVCNAALIAKGRVRYNFFTNTVSASLKLVGLLVAIRFTSDLITIGIILIAIVGAEAGTYLFFLSRAGTTGLRAVVPGIVRIAAAGLLTMGALAASGWGWQPVAMASLPAMGVTCLIGMATVCVFFAADLAIWLVIGRPQGAETKLIEIVGHLGGQRLRGRFAG